MKEEFNDLILFSKKIENNCFNDSDFIHIINRFVMKYKEYDLKNYNKILDSINFKYNIDISYINLTKLTNQQLMAILVWITRAYYFGDENVINQAVHNGTIEKVINQIITNN